MNGGDAVAGVTTGLNEATAAITTYTGATAADTHANALALQA